MYRLGLSIMHITFNAKNNILLFKTQRSLIYTYVSYLHCFKVTIHILQRLSMFKFMYMIKNICQQRIIFK